MWIIIIIYLLLNWEGDTVYVFVCLFVCLFIYLFIIFIFIYYFNYIVFFDF